MELRSQVIGGMGIGRGEPQVGRCPRSEQQDAEASVSCHARFLARNWVLAGGRREEGRREEGRRQRTRGGRAEVADIYLWYSSSWASPMSLTGKEKSPINPSNLSCSLS